MADIELVIKIPEEAKRAFDCAESNDLKAGYYDLGGVIGAAIKNGIPLKKGHWIKSRDCYGNNHFTCSFCEHDIATKYSDTWKDNYCSNCGAKMEADKESE